MGRLSTTECTYPTLSGMTPPAYSRRCILPKITIQTSLASVTAQDMAKMTEW